MSVFRTSPSDTPFSVRLSSPTSFCQEMKCSNNFRSLKKKLNHFPSKIQKAHKQQFFRKHVRSIKIMIIIIIIIIIIRDRDGSINKIMGKYSRLIQKENKSRHNWVGELDHCTRICSRKGNTTGTKGIGATVWEKWSS